MSPEFLINDKIVKITSIASNIANIIGPRIAIIVEASSWSILIINLINTFTAFTAVFLMVFRTPRLTGFTPFSFVLLNQTLESIPLAAPLSPCFAIALPICAVAFTAAFPARAIDVASFMVFLASLLDFLTICIAFFAARTGAVTTPATINKPRIV